MDMELRLTDDGYLMIDRLIDETRPELLISACLNPKQLRVLIKFLADHGHVGWSVEDPKEEIARLEKVAFQQNEVIQKMKESHDLEMVAQANKMRNEHLLDLRMQVAIAFRLQKLIPQSLPQSLQGQ